MPTTITRTITVVTRSPETAHPPLETFFTKADLSTAQLANLYVDTITTDSWWDVILRLIMLLVTVRIASHNFRAVATYIDTSFRNWLDVASPARSFKARMVFRFVITVYLATFTNVGILLCEQLSQLGKLFDSGGQTREGLLGPDACTCLLAAAGVLITHWIVSATAVTLIKYRKVEEKRPDAVLLEPHWWVIVVLGILSLYLSDFCADILGYEGALALVIKATAPKWVQWRY